MPHPATERIGFRFSCEVIFSLAIYERLYSLHEMCFVFSVVIVLLLICCVFALPRHEAVLYHLLCPGSI